MVRCAALVIVLLTAVRAEAQWPQFRGPDGNGSTQAALPLTWTENERIRWRVPIHGRAWSSPVVLGQQVWVTTASEDGRALGAMAVDKTSGKVLFDLPLFSVATPQYAHPFNSYGSPTPVMEPGRIYVTFG